MINDRDYLEPPDNETKKMYKCDICGEYIYEYDGYYDIYGMAYCERCIKEEFYRIAIE